MFDHNGTMLIGVVKRALLEAGLPVLWIGGTGQKMRLKDSGDILKEICETNNPFLARFVDTLKPLCTKYFVDVSFQYVPKFPQVQGVNASCRGADTVVWVGNTARTTTGRIIKKRVFHFLHPAAYFVTFQTNDRTILHRNESVELLQIRVYGAYYSVLKQAFPVTERMLPTYPKSSRQAWKIVSEIKGAIAKHKLWNRFNYEHSKKVRFEGCYMMDWDTPFRENIEYFHSQLQGPAIMRAFSCSLDFGYIPLENKKRVVNTLVELMDTNKYWKETSHAGLLNLDKATIAVLLSSIGLHSSSINLWIQKTEARYSHVKDYMREAFAKEEEVPAGRLAIFQDPNLSQLVADAFEHCVVVKGDFTGKYSLRKAPGNGKGSWSAQDTLTRCLLVGVKGTLDAGVGFNGLLLRRDLNVNDLSNCSLVPLWDDAFMEVKVLLALPAPRTLERVMQVRQLDEVIEPEEAEEAEEAVPVPEEMDEKEELQLKDEAIEEMVRNGWVVPVRNYFRVNCSRRRGPFTQGSTRLECAAKAIEKLGIEWPRWREILKLPVVRPASRPPV